MKKSTIEARIQELERENAKLTRQWNRLGSGKLGAAKRAELDERLFDIEDELAPLRFQLLELEAEVELEDGEPIEIVSGPYDGLSGSFAGRFAGRAYVRIEGYAWDLPFDPEQLAPAGVYQ